MSHILITGANGFVGQGLVKRLLAQGGHTLTLIDRSFDDAPASAQVRQITGSFGDAAVLDAALKAPIDIVFHLASVPGALAEREPALGFQKSGPPRRHVVNSKQNNNNKSFCPTSPGVARFFCNVLS